MQHAYEPGQKCYASNSFSGLKYRTDTYNKESKKKRGGCFKEYIILMVLLIRTPENNTGGEQNTSKGKVRKAKVIYLWLY